MSKVLGGILAVSLIGNVVLVVGTGEEKVSASEPTVIEKVIEKEVTREVSSTDEQEWKLMKAKLVTLTGELAEKNVALDKLQEKLAKLEEQKSQPRQSYVERMKKLQEENPEEYKKIQDRINQMRERVAKGTASRSDFLASLNTDKLNEKQKEALATLQEKMARIDEMAKRGEDATPEEQMEMRREFFSEMRGTRELMSSVRDIAIDSLATDIGYSGEEAKQFREYIDYVNEMTSLRSMFGGRGGRPR